MNSFQRLLLAGLVLAAITLRGLAATPESVDTLVPPYLQLQSALAADDLAAAQAAARRLADSGNEDSALAPVADAAARLATAADIKAARNEFARVSAAFTSLVNDIGTTGARPLYLAHCPMAFGGKGGDWVQGDKKIRNPYYGAMMLGCGGIKQQLAGN